MRSACAGEPLLMEETPQERQGRRASHTNPGRAAGSHILVGTTVYTSRLDSSLKPAKILREDVNVGAIK